jgi:hypothetical protein
MRITRTSRYRWLPVRIDDFEKWQSGLLEESARQLGALLDPDGRVHRWALSARRLRSAGSVRGCG